MSSYALDTGRKLQGGQPELVHVVTPDGELRSSWEGAYYTHYLDAWRFDECLNRALLLRGRT